MLAVVLKQADLFPGTGDQQHVADGQLLVAQVARQWLAPAADTQHAQAVPAAERSLTQGLADQFRIRRQQHFDHAELFDQTLPLVILDW